MILNPNDINSKYYNSIYDHIKGKIVTDQECLLIIGLINNNHGKILDIGAGTGRHAIELTNRGYHITALDSSSGMLAEIPKINNLKVIHQDIFRYSIEAEQSMEKFDVIMLMWNTFNEIGLSLDRAELLLQKLKSLIKAKSGLILINTENITEFPFVPEFNFTKQINGHKYEVNWKNIITNKLTNITKSLEQITIDGDQEHKAYITQRWYSFEQIKSLATKVGLHTNLEKIKANNELYIVLN